MIVIKIGNAFTKADKNVFKNILEMKQIILPFEWHSFCISIDPINQNMKFYHNNRIQAEQDFTMTHGDKKGIAKLMTKAHLGGAKFVGFLTDLQIFGSAIPDDAILGWTSCQSQVRFLSIS